MSQSPPEVSGTALIAGNLGIAIAEGLLQRERFEGPTRESVFQLFLDKGRLKNKFPKRVD